jgi:hypothetical protein
MDTIKAILIDPAAHSVGEDGVQPVELPVDGDTRIDEINRLLGSTSFESASSLLYRTARNSTLFVDANPADENGQVHWCWTWDLSEPVIGKGLILGVDKEGNSVDTPISERQAWEHIRFAPRRLKGAEMLEPRPEKMFGMDTMVIGARRIAPIVDGAGNDLLIQQTFLSGKPLIPNDLAEKLFANWAMAAANSNAETPHFPDEPPVVKLFMPASGWVGYIQAVDPSDPRRAFGVYDACPLTGGRAGRGIIDLDQVALFRAGMLPVERDKYVDLDKSLSHYAKELAAA